MKTLSSLEIQKARILSKEALIERQISFCFEFWRQRHEMTIIDKSFSTISIDNHRSPRQINYKRARTRYQPYSCRFELLDCPSLSREKRPQTKFSHDVPRSLRNKVPLFPSIILTHLRDFGRATRRLINVDPDVICSRLSLESLDSAT